MIQGHRTRDLRSRRYTPSEFAPVDLAGCALWLRADKGITLNGSTVAAWANQGTLGGSFTQGTASAQPTFGASSGPNSRAVLTFDGGDYLASDLAASNWSFLHSQNFTLYVVFRSTTNSTSAFGSLLATYDGTVTNHGLIVGWDNRSSISRDDALGASIGRGAASYLYSTASANGASPFNTWQLAELVQQHGSSGSDLIATINGTSVLGVEPSGTPSSSSPTGTLHIGSLTGGIAPLTGGIAELFAFNRTLNAGERSRLRRYLGSYYAITVT